MFKEILFYLFSLILQNKEDTYIKQYMIDTKYVPQYMYWIDDINILLSSYGYTEIYNIRSRKSNVVGTCENCIYGYDKSFIYCKYENRNITSKEQFSTTVSVYDKDDSLIFSKDIFPTVMPITCSKSNLLLRTSDPILEQNLYSLNLRDATIKGIPLPNTIHSFKGVEPGYVAISKRKDMKGIVVLDKYYRLWLYLKK